MRKGRAARGSHEDRSKRHKIGALMRQPDAWDREEEALDLAYGIQDGRIQASALKAIADRMCEPR